MKKSVFFIGFVLMTSFYSFGQTEKRVESKITGVTIFLNRAQVTRSIKTRVDAGKSALIISGLTSQLDPESIQVTGGGNAIILGINHQQNFLDEFNVPASIKILKDSVEYLQTQTAAEIIQIEILSKEEQLLISNQKIGGTQQNLTVNELRAMADFYRTRMTEISRTKANHSSNIKKMNERIAVLQKQINSRSELFRRNTSEIVVNLSSSASANVELAVSYVVNNAGWYPVYDLRAANTSVPIQLSYKANVFQSTGENWDEVALKLSTGNPSLSGQKPELSSWFLDFYYPVAYMRREMGAGAPSALQKSMDMEEAEAPLETVANYVSAVQTTLNTEFVISLPYSIPSASKPTTVDIGNHAMKSIFSYSVTPKLDTDAFLVAKATEWKDFNLLPGEANIFFEGTFVGKTFIDPNAIGDTLSVSLGRDQRIVVKREQQKDFTSTRLIGSNKREAFAWKISVHNTQAEKITIKVDDQLPVSKNSEIEVTPLDLGAARMDPVTGKLAWELTLQPGETKSVTFAYEVKYPKDRQVGGL